MKRALSLALVLIATTASSAPAIVMETQMDPLGQVSTQAHGLRNRLDEVTYSLHTTPRTLPSVDSESWVYDANGNVEAVTQCKLTVTGQVQVTTTREYDVLDRLERETRYDTRATAYSYDAKGNRTQVTDFQGVGTTYAFDAQDRLRTAVTAEGPTTYGYFPDGLMKSTAFFNGTYEGRCYDDAGRLTALVTARSAVGNACAPGPFVSRHRYAHDAEGNRATQVEELTPAGATAVGTPEFTEYGYDDESRLVGVRYPDNTAALYQLDAVGNRVGERKAASAMVPVLTAAAFLAMSPTALTNDVVAVFNRADWLESVTDSRAPAKDATFEWDVAGNLKRQQTAGRDRRFTWDVKQTLTKVEDNGIEAGRYDYGADGLRSKRVTALESVEYVLDGMQVLVETDGAASGHPAKRRYHYGSAALAVTDISGATRTTKALHLDALGSPTTETTQTGVVATVRQYDAWGQYRNGTAPGSTDTKLGYTGHQYDVETGLVYARARYYDPEYGRFLSRDTYEGQLNSAPSLHRFAYGNFNPLRYTDPLGLCVEGEDDGCSLGFTGFPRAVLASIATDETYQDARGRIQEENSQKHQQDVQRREEQGPTKTEVATEFVEEKVVAPAVKKVVESRAGKVVLEAREAASELGGNASREAFTGLNPYRPESERYGDAEKKAQSIGKDLGSKAAEATFDTAVTKGVTQALPLLAGVKNALTNRVLAIRRGGQVIEAVEREVAATVPKPTKYVRPSGATTPAQRASVQGKPCVDCGATSAKNYADHKSPLVEQHYEGGGIDEREMKSLKAVQPQCPTCSNRQGADLSRYSREKAKELGLEK